MGANCIATVNNKAFCTAFARTMQHEGGLVDDPADNGGMTYMGIARNYWFDWEGWPLVDSLVAQKKPLSADNLLNKLVVVFYKREYWDRLQCGFVANLAEEIALELFDTAVHLGQSRAIEILQESLNLLNRNQQLYDDIVVDGVFGKETRHALTDFVAQCKDRQLVKLMNHLQAEQYIVKMRQNPYRERFAGWFERT